MAYITKFTIENFKGIKNLSLDMSDRNDCPIITLVGLNESGKTTILEALAHFTTSEDTIAAESKSGSDSENISALVPISQRANFTGEIKITASIVMEASDIEGIEKIIKRHDRTLDKENIAKDFEISNTYTFNEGNYVPQKWKSVWGFDFDVKTTRERKYKTYERPSEEEIQNGEPDLWLLCVKSLRKSLPSIAYFPSFLVDIPDRIYLAPCPEEQDQQKYYRKVLQDVLDRGSEGKERIDTHIVERVRKFFEKNGPDGSFSNSSERKKIQPMIRKIQTLINQEVIKNWENISGQDVSTISVFLEWDVDEAKGNIPYVEFSISDGVAQFILSERSLGFRWFFLFLLFTRFKRDENRPTIFLFDEPAANLHGKAQKEMLGSFKRIIENKNKIVYSTHSAHMINPQWLSSAYIVENEAIGYEGTNAQYNFSSKPTSISITSYRRFVGEYSNRSSYFQPILDKLNHVSSALEPGGRVLLTEGISDFHAFTFYCADILEENGISVLPGCGAGAHKEQISILIQQGATFIVVLDDDAEGKKAAKRYCENWLLYGRHGRHVATIGELALEAKSKKLETLLSDETRGTIAKHFKAEVGSLSKKQIGLYFAEVNAGLMHAEKSVATESLIRSIVEEAVSRILSQAVENA